MGSKGVPAIRPLNFGLNFGSNAWRQEKEKGPVSVDGTFRRWRVAYAGACSVQSPKPLP